MADFLIVEDDADAAEALAEAMRFEGHEVRVACDGAEGLLRLAERVPDLVILDVEMPILSGPGMAYQMVAHNAGHEQIPIVLVSGVPDLGLIAGELGTPYFLRKPYRYERLLAVLEVALRERIAPKLAVKK